MLVDVLSIINPINKIDIHHIRSLYVCMYTYIYVYYINDIIDQTIAPKILSMALNQFTYIIIIVLIDL